MNFYFHHGNRRECIRVNWIGLPAGFVVRRQSATGYVTGHLSEQLGWGRCERANFFPTAQEAERAASRQGVRLFEILRNNPHNL